MSDELKDILEQYRAMKEQRDELLEALQTVLTEWDALYPSFPRNDAIEDAEFSGFQMARAAIAKATGEPPCAA